MAAKKEYPLAILIRTVDKHTAGIRKVNAQIDKVAKKVTAVGKTMSTHITAPIVGIGAASVAAFSSFEKGMSNVSTLIDENAENMDAMGRNVLAMGTRVGVPIEQLTGGLYDVRSAGIDAGDAMGVLEKSAMLGVAGLGTTQEAVDLATSSINAFGLTGEKADRVYDQIFKTVKNGKTTISGLSQGFGAVAGTVAATGTELDEYLAAVAALTTTGLPAAQAHTQMKAAISGLTRVTKDSRKVFRKLGAKDFKDLIAKSGGLVPAFERIKTQLKGNEGAMLKLFGSTEALNAVLGLTGEQAETFAATFDDMRNGSEAMTAGFDKQSRTMTARWQRTKNALMAAGVTIGEVLVPALEVVANHLQAAAAWFSRLDKRTKKWIVTVAAVAAAVGPAVVIVGKLTSAFAFLRTAFVVAAAAVRVLSVALMANPIAIAVMGIASAAALIYLNWEPLKGFFLRLWDRVREPFFRFLGWVKTAFLTFTPLGRIIKHWEPIKAFFTSLWDGVTGVFRTAWDYIKPIVDKIIWAGEKAAGAARAVQETLGKGVLGARVEGGAITQLTRRVMRERSGESSNIFSATSPRALLAGAGGHAQGAAGGETTVKVEFANAPRGTRVAQESRGATVDLSVGYQMAVP